MYGMPSRPILFTVLLLSVNQMFPAESTVTELGRAVTVGNWYSVTTWLGVVCEGDTVDAGGGVTVVDTGATLVTVRMAVPVVEREGGRQMFEPVRGGIVHWDRSGLERARVVALVLADPIIPELYSVNQTRPLVASIFKLVGFTIPTWGGNEYS